MKGKVCIAGAGSIGVAFALLFAKSGFRVNLWDALEEALPRAKSELTEKLAMLVEHGLLEDSRDTVLERVTFEPLLAEALKGAELVQECVPENLEIKKQVFQELGALSEPYAVLASSSSAIVASQFASEIPARDRVLIGHPGNPPYLIPVIEIVPSEFTSAETVERAQRVYREAGLKPVLVNSEIEGFIFNRLQGAVLREAWCLVRDGIASVDDIDEVMRSGLGRRWAFIGPFETSDLNTRGGTEVHAERMGPAYERMGKERGQFDPWTPDLVREVVRQRREILPLEDWGSRVLWRDEQLMKLKKLLDG